MKVLHIITSDTGGAGIGAIRQHLSLLDIGVDSKMLSCYKKSNSFDFIEAFPSIKPKSFITRFSEKIGYFSNKYDLELMKASKLGKPFAEGGTFELFSNPYSNLNINNHPLVKEADIINLHWTSGFLDIPSFFVSNKKPIVWTLHDMYPYLGGFHYDIDLENNPTFKSLEEYYKKIKIKALSNANYAVVGNSNWNTQKAAESTVFKNAKSFHTVYYPLLDSQFLPLEKNTAKSALNIPTHKFVIGFACENLSNPRKGYKHLLESLEMLPDNLKSNLLCLNFGSISTANNKIKNLETIELGSVSNPKLQSIVFAAMDLFIIPSTAEAFGLTAMEAMVCKTPVLGNNIGGIPEMIKNDVTGFLFESSVSNSLLINLLKIIDLSLEKRQLIAENGYYHIMKQHNSKDIGIKYKKIYQSFF